MWRLATMGSPEVVRVSDTSPDSAEASFRELDDVFLQTQARIWLGEVLNVRLDEDVGIADLLADGELLFQVSKVVWKMLLNNHGELKHSKVHIFERTTSGKSEGRYMPYPKVDSFLKACQILGLTSIDLFSASDAVDKRDIRRVCMCIRSLSKKARIKNLKVPDFDIVTYNIAMPTNLVGGIRRNLELSQCSSSNSNVSSPWNDSRETFGLRIPFGEHSKLSDSGLDEAESFIDLEFNSPLSSASYDATDIVGETSPGLSSVVGEIVHETCFRNSIRDRKHYEHVDENQDEIFDESIGSSYFSTRETQAIRSMCFFDSDRDLLKQSDDPFYPGKQNSRNHSIQPLISSSFSGSEFECSSSSSMCSMCTDKNSEDEANYVCMSTFKVDLRKVAKNASSKLKSDIEVSSKFDDTYIFDHSCQIRENLLVNVDGTLSEETCSCFNFNRANSACKNSVSKYASKDLKNRAFSSHDTQRDDYGNDVDVLRVVESSEIVACNDSAEMIPGFDFCHYELFPSSRISLGIEVKNLQTVDSLPRSNPDFRDRREAISDESFSVEKHVVFYNHDTVSVPNNVTQAILDSTLHQQETITVVECGKNNNREGRTVGKSGNKVIKSVARVMTIVGALVFLLHLSRQKKDEEKNTGTVVSLQVQKQNQEFFTKRKTEIVKSNSLYPGEKLRFKNF